MKIEECTRRSHTDAYEQAVSFVDAIEQKLIQSRGAGIEGVEYGKAVSFVNADEEKQIQSQGAGIEGGEYGKHAAGNKSGLDTPQ